MTVPKTLTDAELVAAVAWEVMEWANRSGVYMEKGTDNWTGWYASATENRRARIWQPLTDWNDTMTVVAELGRVQMRWRWCVGCEPMRRGWIGWSREAMSA